MADATAFEEFVTTRSSGLLRVATLLTRDHALAEDLLQTALARSWSVWKRIDGDPEPYVYQILTNTYRTWWRRRWHAERPTERLPEVGEPGGQVSVEARDEIWQALNRLPRQQRVVLVLRYFEDLTEAQVAQTLGISQGAVKSHASRGLAKLRLDPALLAEFPVPRPPVSTERLAAVRERVRQRHHHRVMGVIAIVIAIVAGLAIAPSLLRNVFPPAKPPTPQHFQGYLVKDTVSVKLAELDRFTTEWRPSTLDYMFTSSCDTRDVRFVAVVSVRINGQRFTDVPCSAEPEPLGARTQVQDATNATLRIGEPVVVMLQLQILHGTVIPPDATLSMAFAELVPFGELPTPARPAKLKPLEPPYAEPVTVLQWFGGALLSLQENESLELLVRSQTPGLIHITINGQELQTCTFWDYDAACVVNVNPAEPASRDLGVRVGETFTIKVSAEYVTGEWYVAVIRRRS
jgi:RNA polymerase sigma-70 factor (sigma-E family)